MVAILQTTFNYDLLDSESRIVIKQRAIEIKGLIRATGQQIIEIGRKLREVRDLLAIKGGDSSISKGKGFNAWLEQEFSMSRAAAYRFMKVAEMADNLSVGQASVLESLEATALYELASAPQEIQVSVLEAAENVSITKSVIQEIKQSREELIAKLKLSEIGDYCRMHDGKIAKIVNKTDLSVIVEYCLSKQVETYHIQSESKCFQDVIALAVEDWILNKDDLYDDDVCVVLNSETYRGWDIGVIQNSLDFTGGYCHNQESSWYFDSICLEIPQLTIDKEWYFVQAKRFIDYCEENNPRPDIPQDLWSPEKTPLGDYHCQLQGDYDLRLMKVEATLYIAGACITHQKSDRVWIFWDDQEPSLISRFPQITCDPDWWVAQGQLFVDNINIPLRHDKPLFEIGNEVYYQGKRATIVSFSPSDGDGTPCYRIQWQEKGETNVGTVSQTDLKPSDKKRPTGHLKATVKNTGQNIPNHPDYDNWDVGDIAYYCNQHYRVAGRNPDNLLLINSIGDEITANYSEIKKYQGKQTVSLAYANRGSDEILPYATFTRSKNKTTVIVAAESTEVSLCHCKDTKQALDIAEYFNAILNGQLEIPKNWRKQIK